MSTKVKAVLGEQLYYTTVTAGNNVLITDEPTSLGGGDKGFNPMEVLATSLASCTAATLRMYADRKGWDLGELAVEIELTQDKEAGNTVMEKQIKFGAPLDEKQLQRLMVIADKCPVHKILTGEVIVNSSVKA